VVSLISSTKTVDSNPWGRNNGPVGCGELSQLKKNNWVNEMINNMLNKLRFS
jgi:hypothetical protein